MLGQLTVEQTPDTIGFARLRTLALRGYRPIFDLRDQTAGFVSVRLEHPRRKRDDAPPKLMLWNDGTIATTGLLWPKLFVATEDGPPGWQKYILAGDEKTFSKFADSVARPTGVDLYLVPALRNLSDLAKKLAVGGALCAIIAGAIMLAKCLF